MTAWGVANRHLDPVGAAAVRGGRILEQHQLSSANGIMAGQMYKEAAGNAKAGECRPFGWTRLARSRARSEADHEPGDEPHETGARGADVTALEQNGGLLVQ